MAPSGDVPPDREGTLTMRAIATVKTAPLLLAGVLLVAVAVAAVILGGSRSAGAQELIAEPSGVDLVEGANLVVYDGPTTDVPDGLNNIADVVVVVWAFDAPDQVWLLWAPALPEALQGFSELEQGRPYFIIVAAAVTWLFPTGASTSSMPPLVFLTVSDQVFLPEPGSYCWPVEPGVGICADTIFPSFDRFFSLEGGPVALSWEEPFPDSFNVQLLDAAGESTGFSAEFDEPMADWAPEAPAGDYILSVFGRWTALPGGGGGDASYFFPIHVDDGLFTPVEVLAPILSVVKGVEDGETTNYFLSIESGLPNGCHAFSRFEVDTSGSAVNVSVYNTAPPEGAEIACTLVFGMVTSTVDLGATNPSTVIVNGDEYDV